MIEEVSIPCSNCHNSLNVVPSDVERIVKCSACGRFNKIPARVQRRLQLNCPQCNSPWNVPVKLRGKPYRCWNCSVETYLPTAPKLIIKGISIPQQVQQGGNDYEIVVTVANPGSTADISGIEMAFESSGQDVNSHFSVSANEDNPSEVGNTQPIELSFFISVSEEAPLGPTQIYIQLSGEDSMDQSSITVETVIEWNIVPKRVFAIATENELKEKAGVPFAIQIWACLETGEVDTQYSGMRKIVFQTSATATISGMQPSIPVELMVQFEEGIGTTDREFLLFNAKETPQIMAIAEGLEQAEGCSDFIEVEADVVQDFFIEIDSPQTNGCPFKGECAVQAVDQYGNPILNFAEDVWVHPQSNQGELSINGEATNKIQASAFENGVVDLVALNMAYTGDPSDQFPKIESFIVSYQEKEGRSPEVVIEKNPLEFSITRIDAPALAEQSREFDIVINVTNLSDFSLQLFKMETAFFVGEENADEFYQISLDPENVQTIPPQSDANLKWSVLPQHNTPLGITRLDVGLHLREPEQQLADIQVGSCQWQVEPRGRSFRLVSESPIECDAGKPVGFKIATYLEDKIDTSYGGSRQLHIETNASGSPTETLPQIPSPIDVVFTEGIAEVPAKLIFTNAGEEPEIRVIDTVPGGARSEAIPVVVLPGEFAAFWLMMDRAQINGEEFSGRNQVMAIDECGNLVPDFIGGCEIFPSSGTGKITIGGVETSTIPASSFNSGIVDLTELKIAYDCGVGGKLPRQEKFCVTFGDKRGESAEIAIQPKPAQISLTRITKPDRLEPGTEGIVSIELENKGNAPATVTSALFSFFYQERDISSKYLVVPNPGNSSSLVPNVPLLLNFTIKIDHDTPMGDTRIVLNIAGIENGSNNPVKAQTEFQWLIEDTKGRSFAIETQNGNREIAGQPFSLKITALRDDVKDRYLQGERQLLFSSTASPSRSEATATIPNTLSVSFTNGEAITPAQFVFTNSEEQPVIQANETGGAVQGKTKPVLVRPGELATFHLHVPEKMKNCVPLDEGTILAAIDKYGNIKTDFERSVNVSLEGISGHIADSSGTAIAQLSAELFENGAVDMAGYKLRVVCDPSEQLPKKAKIVLEYEGKILKSAPFELAPRPITIDIEAISAPFVVVCDKSYKISLNVHNSGDIPVPLAGVDFVFENSGRIDQRYQVSADNSNLAEIIPGSGALYYHIFVGKEALLGDTRVDVTLKTIEPASQRVLTTEDSFDWTTEPAGRSFIIHTENNQKETAGIPFSLRIVASIDEKQDTNYNGVRRLCFECNTTPSPNGNYPQIPQELELDFRNGQAKTPREFCLYTTTEQATISVKENFEGGAGGVADFIQVIPGATVGGFEIDLEPSQKNGTPFAGDNILSVKDIFGNIKVDFANDISLRPHSNKGEIQLEQLGMVNSIPASSFHRGIVDLTALGISYHADLDDILPKSETFVASYGDKQGESDEITIDPRPAGLQFNSVEFKEKVFQGEVVCPLMLQLKNTGDSPIQIKRINLIFSRGDEDISSQFSVAAHPNNPISLAKNNSSGFTFDIDIDEEAHSGNVALKIQVDTCDAHSGEGIFSEREIEFLVSEKPRTFLMKSENDNIEMVGEAFFMMISAHKDGELDVMYSGSHEIRFSSTAKSANNHAPQVPKSEVIEFNQGVGATTRSFVLTNSSERPTITAEEEGRAKGSSDEIVVRTGPICKIQVSFKDDQEECYNLHPMDRFSNPVEKEFSLDEDIKPGMILSGSRGMFYEVQDVIGHGAMGKVYKAIRLNDGLTVAIKTMLFSALSDISRFVLEAYGLIRFDHPNIVKGYDLRQLCVIERGKPVLKFFMVMEFLPGQSVKDLIDSSRSGMLNPTWATQVVLQAAKALAYMWENNTIHRDVKPENIQVTEDKVVKLIDLGIATSEGGMRDIELTQRDTIIGSYPYISPERLRNSTVDYKADVYSLGATFYHMVTGMPPYLDSYRGPGGRNLLEYLIKIRTKRAPTAPRKLESSIPASVSNVIMTMIQIRPNKRCNNPQEIINSLEQVYRELS